MKEVFLQEEINSRLTKQLNVKIEDLTKMFSILRLPRMTNEFQQAMRRHHSVAVYKKYEKDAINHLESSITEANKGKFFDGFVEHLFEEQVKDQ